MSDFETLRVADMAPEHAASVLLGCVVPRSVKNTFVTSDGISLA